MNEKEKNSHNWKPALTAAPVSICFFVIGFLSFWAATATIFRHPEMVLGDPYRTEVLALSHLMILGWISSLIFGAGYMVLPVMASSRLWSMRLAWIHLAVHAIGLPWMLAGFISFDYAEVGHGGSAVVLGIILFVLNMMMTASKRNRWDVAQMTFISALFWLCITAGIALFMLVNRYIPVTSKNPQWLVAMHAHFGLLGYLWMILLGSALKLLQMFLISARRPGFFSWCGWIVLNASLLMIIPGEIFGYTGFRYVLTCLLAFGSLLYFVDIVRLFITTRGARDWGMWTALCGLLAVGLLFVWMLGGKPTFGVAAEAGIREQVRMYFVLAIFGPFTLAIFGMGTRILPFLVWQMRFAGKVGGQKLPTAQELINRQGLFPVWISLITGWLYLGAGQLTGDSTGTEIGTMLMLIGAGWFFYTMVPALRSMLVD